MKEGVLLANNSDWKPWYRRRTFKGNLTEDQKRYLDSFRNGEPHPATSFEDLPDEVRSRLIELEERLKNHQDVASVCIMLFWMGICFYSIYVGYFGEFGLNSVLIYGSGLLGIVNFYNSYKSYSSRNQHHNWYGVTEKGEPFSSTDESLQRHWEMKALTAYKRGQKGPE